MHLFMQLDFMAHPGFDVQLTFMPPNTKAHEME